MVAVRAAATREEYRVRNETFVAFLQVMAPLSERSLLEIGAGCGANVPYFLDWGVRSARITLNELDADLAARARVLFPDVRVLTGDAASLDVAPHDIVVASTVFTSVLADEHRQRIAQAMWRLTNPGG